MQPMRSRPKYKLPSKVSCCATLQTKVRTLPVVLFVLDGCAWDIEGKEKWFTRRHSEQANLIPKPPLRIGKKARKKAVTCSELSICCHLAHTCQYVFIAAISRDQLAVTYDS